MPNPFFRFKQFTVYHHRSAMKVTTDGCLFGAWCAAELAEGKEGAGGEQTVLDIGAGTGLLSLMVAQKAAARVDAVELDASAAGQAEENVAASPWKDRIAVHQGDILEFSFPHAYDCIISNPPFYEKEIESASAGRNLAHHGHGLQLRPLLQLMGQHLLEDGSFFLLLPYKRLAEIEREVKKAGLFLEKKVVVRQSVRHDPFRLLLKGGRRETPLKSSELSIWDGQQQYTPEFVALLKDYYLYL
ncbi:methyltransferase [Paraflavisolibacter sp. H34]|uniref:tRNA1(Val) (adenine(37)-N6)-methyltransferase n=1 Tax=Huijunlia imazamoxiresistens TaxID=3127457 RepID=UPI00301805AC